MYSRLTYRPDGIAVYCDWDTSHVIVYDHPSEREIAQFQIQARTFGLDLSWDSKRLLTTNWHRLGLDVWDVPGGFHHEVVPLPLKMGRIVCDRDGYRVAVLLRKGFVVADLRSPWTAKIERCAEDLDFASLAPAQNQFLVPMLLRGKIKEILFESLAVVDISLPIDGMARCIRHSPDGGRYAVIDTKKTLHLFESRSHAPVWSTSLAAIAGKDHVGVVDYSADGTIVAASITRTASTDVVTLDARTGTVLSQFVNSGCCSGFPFLGTLVIQLEQATSPTDPARVFDLATGHRTVISLKRK
jgi:hypothetical protein